MKLHQISILFPLILAVTANGAPGVSGEDAALAVLASDSSLEKKAMAIVDLSVTGTAKAVPVLANLLADKELHDYARNALELIPDPAAGAALLAALDKLEGKLRTGVVITLGDRRENAAVPALQKMAADPKCPAADAALSSLALIGTNEAVQSILAALKGGPADLKVAAGHAALRAAGRMAKDNPSRALLVEAVRTADVPAHLKAAAEGVK